MNQMLLLAAGAAIGYGAAWCVRRAASRAAQEERRRGDAAWSRERREVERLNELLRQETARAQQERAARECDAAYKAGLEQGRNRQEPEGHIVTDFAMRAYRK